ncbi:helix-turn-helix domain-containing protein [Bombiscardovia coagulans]|uniref:Transcriptional regulator n=1 Tax=Bombiscardovia coagulans TaxID=686666 RepID=A0A261ESJ5_9BIFI|nr:helix-turn-helix transcriptional regulator [Bombiscardovia coagulans]OZG49805.1 transcriptional regulator [Bombiscardovia coagulans]
MRSPYSYEELAYDLYKAENDVLNKLVTMRKQRKMSQQDLADEMGVSQSYISKIENGQIKLTSLLTEYALEVGARIEYEVEDAEQKSEGKRYYSQYSIERNGTALRSWSDNSMSCDRISWRFMASLPKSKQPATSTIIIDAIPHQDQDKTEFQRPVVDKEELIHAR